MASGRAESAAIFGRRAAPASVISVPRLVVPLVLALALVAAYALAACGSAGPEAVADDADWTYVGDASCQQCHADLAASYAQTGMGRSVSVFDPASAPERFDASGEGPVVCAGDGYCYQPFVRGDSLFQRETRPDTPGYERVHAVSHVVGSGHATRSYFMQAGATEAGAYLTEMPLTWYVERGIWDLSPGYEQTNERFDRPITLDCHTCHNARPGHAESQNFFTDVPLGISCERCHGPGSAHVAAFEAGGEPLDSRIVNPASLPTDLQLDVCQQCHLTGETVYAVGEDATTYRPGRPLSAHRSVYATEESLSDPEAFGIASHAERMMKSACFEESLGTGREMTCTTCHDPHRPVAQLDADHFATSCQSCHAADAHQAVCSRPEAETVAEAATGDCVSCHMRTAGTSDIPHVSFTDHWIRRDPPEGSADGPTAASFRRETPFRLVELTTGGGDVSRLDAAEADLRLGMATFLLYETRHRLPDYLPEVAARIRRGLAAGADRADARVTLGRALLDMDSLASAERALTEAVEADTASAQAHLWLGVVRVARGRDTEAVAPLRTAVRLAPRFTETRLQLAKALSATGERAAAAEALEAALDQDPLRHAGAWNDLGFLRLQLGRTEAATNALRRAVALDPREPTARANLGTARLAAGDLDAAAAQFEAALRLDARSVAALGNLGVVRAQQGRVAEARTLFERLLAVDPNDARARAALAQL